MLGGLAIHPRVANFPQCLCVKNYENWLAVDKVIAKIIRLTFLAHPVGLTNTQPTLPLAYQGAGSSHAACTPIN